MNMMEYLESVKFAATTLIEIINTEQRAIDDLKKGIKAAKQEADEWWDKMPQGGTMEAYTLYSEQTIFQLNLSEELRQELNQKISVRAVKETSITVLSGALLQLAKQGVSIVNSNPYLLPESSCGNEIKNSSNKKIQWNKPLVGFVNLKVSDLIIAARNQSSHYEEGLSNKNNHNIEVFKALENANPRLFQEIKKADLKSNGGSKDPKNFAKNVVMSLLKWKTYSDFEKDLLSIG
ncbi:hypothetical protein J7J00_11570 [Bacillus sp. ISL-4]|uniref:hypothetical protein n=1 Tax=Bacillus sp. ISL-4 TaxID=2819125 RepID=UPI001BEC5E03|nr:hypothetical protein [Bacillus sp. ISL-4]MBT2666144.1 hypothetical protein [Bacillus sp. ISL-4]MBT2670182.1 hypothetical protein [Streptomyces sp. ISL-14]